MHYTTLSPSKAKYLKQEIHYAGRLHVKPESTHERLQRPGLSGRCGCHSTFISELSEFESWIRSTARMEDGNCLHLCSLLTSSRILCDNWVDDILDKPASGN
uniref:Uncharacterized protein n=1 Tax=Glossina pallidipes TaxID=7398 RepID=A0A1B0ACT3_GLOPL